MPRDFGVTTRARLGLAIHATRVAGADSRVPVPRAAVQLGRSRCCSSCCVALAVIAVRHDVPLPVGHRLRRDGRARADRASRSSARCPRSRVIFPPIAVNALSGRERLLRAGNLANLAAYGWYTLAGGARCSQPPRADAAARRRLRVLAAVGAPAARRQLGGRPGRLRDAVARPPAARVAAHAAATALPAGVAMTTLGALTVVAVRARRRCSRSPSSPSSPCCRRARSPSSARTRPVAALDPLTAARRYAPRWPSTSGSTGDERRELDAVIRTRARARRRRRSRPSTSGHTVVDWSEVSCAAGHVTEWWNGAGGPAGLPGRLIPRPARIAAVARTWAALTADGQPVPRPRRGALAPRERRRRAARPARRQRRAPTVVGQERRLRGRARARAAHAPPARPGAAAPGARRRRVAPTVGAPCSRCGRRDERGQRLDAVRVEPAHARLVAASARARSSSPAPRGTGGWRPWSRRRRRR